MKYWGKMGVSVDKMRQKLNCSANQSHLLYFDQLLTTTTNRKIDFCLWCVPSKSNSLAAFFSVIALRNPWDRITDHKDTRSSLQSPLSNNQTKLHSFPQIFSHIFLLMSKKYVIIVNEKYVLDHCEAFPHGCTIVTSFHFPLKSSEFYWPFFL